jgi:hypothetical protein
MPTIVRIPPAVPPPSTYDLKGLDEETAVALRTLLYAIESRSQFPGLDELHKDLQRELGDKRAVLTVLPAGSHIKITRTTKG